jgi:hypothetical protein
MVFGFRIDGWCFHRGHFVVFLFLVRRRFACLLLSRAVAATLPEACLDPQRLEEVLQAPGAPVELLERGGEAVEGFLWEPRRCRKCLGPWLRWCPLLVRVHFIAPGGVRTPVRRHFSPYLRNPVR